MKLGIFFLMFVSLFVIACSPSSCMSPFTEIDGVCCLDEGHNNICDHEESAYYSNDIIANSSFNSSSITTDSEVGSTPVEINRTEDPIPKPDLSQAKKVAELWAQAYQSKQYKIMYSYFSDNLKKRKSLKEFEAIMELNPSNSGIVSVKVISLKAVSDNKVKIEVKVATPIKDYMMPETYVVYDEGWKIEGMAEVFYVDTFGAACPFQKEFNKERCAKELAIKLQDPEYCERSRCYYTECLEELRSSLNKKERVIACNLCPPVMTTTQECILNVAVELDDISVCDEIPERTYADRYCKCYGGYARAKGNSDYCKRISNPDYKDLCIEGFEGKRC